MHFQHKITRSHHSTYLEEFIASLICVMEIENELICLPENETEKMNNYEYVTHVVHIYINRSNLFSFISTPKPQA